MGKKLSGRRGITLIIVIFAMMLFGILGWTLAMLITTDFDANLRTLESERALYVAEAGVYWARNRLKTNSSWRTNATYGYPAGYALLSLAPGECQVVCRDPQAPETATAVIVSTGYVPAQANYMGMRQVKVFATFGSSFSLGNVLYSTGNVSLSGNADINNGDVTTTGTVSLSGNAGVNNGDVTQNAPPQPLPAITVPDPPLNSASLGALTVSGNNTVNLPSGNYKYTQITLSGNGVLNLTGPIKIYLTGATSLTTSGNAQFKILSGPIIVYVDGAVSISGNGIVSNTHNVNDFTIYATATNNKNITLSGNGDFYGVIYAPTSDLIISGNGSYYGAYVGNDVTMSGNASMYYDPTLSTMTIQGQGGTTSLSWQEQ